MCAVAERMTVGGVQPTPTPPSALIAAPNAFVAANIAANDRLMELIGEEVEDPSLVTDIGAHIGSDGNGNHLIVTAFTYNGERFTYSTCIRQTGAWHVCRVHEPIAAAEQPAVAVEEAT